jgi:hypothetical protein
MTMKQEDKIRKRLFFTGGTDQDSRYSPVLEEGFLETDPLGLTNLMAKTVEYARVVAFYGADNFIDGDWEFFFTADETILMGLIVGTDTDHIKSMFQDPVHVMPEKEQYQLCCKLAEKIDFWFKKFNTIDTPVSKKMGQLIRMIIVHRLQGEIRYLRTLKTGTGAYDFNGFHEVWGDKETGDHEVIDDTTLLKKIFFALINGVAYIQKAASAEFTPSMETGTHDPGAGLFITFLRLFELVRARANRFPEKYLDFYYYDVLKGKPSRSEADSTYLIFKSDQEKEGVVVEKGSVFVCDLEDEDRELVYTADDGIRVNATEVRSVSTLFFEKNPMVSPEKEMDFVTGIFRSTIPVKEKSPWHQSGQQESFSLFGTSHPRPGQEGFEPGQMGLAVASPVLLLKQGAREISVCFDYSVLSGKDNWGVHALLSTRLAIIKEKSSQENELEINDLFFKVFSNAFHIYLTGETGWVKIDDYLPFHRIVNEKWRPGCLEFQLSLPSDHEPIVPYASQVHGGQYVTDSPVIKFLLNPDAHAYLFSFLKDFVIRKIGIEVRVKGIRDMVLYNNTGRLSTNIPFAPFGPIPGVGASFIAGSHETANKSVTRLDLNLEWDLPRKGMRFKQYYDGYGKDDDTRFLADASVLYDGALHPEDPGERIRLNLFQDGENSGGAGFDSELSPRVKLTLKADEIRLFKQKSRYLHEAEFDYHANTKDGFVQFTLVEPGWGFGHKEYQMLLSAALTKNAMLKKAGIPHAIPNPPYTPTVSTISMDYIAETVIDIENVKSPGKHRSGNSLFHIHPWGMEPVRVREREMPVFFLPQFFRQPGRGTPDNIGEHFDGSLFIGLTGSSGWGHLTLFFHLRKDSYLTGDDEEMQIQWCYLANDQWKPIKAHGILSDSTRGFLSSGIITLAIPDDISKENAVMPAGQYWLRVSAKGNLGALCSLYSVQTHAVQVTRSGSEGSDTLPSGSIKSAKVSIPGINNIYQAMDFFNGKAPETDLGLKKRYRERLRHKNRAVTAWDYERIVLERFPELFKVKCFTNFVCTHRDTFTHDFQENLRRSTAAGHVLIVVVPGCNDRTVDENQNPLLNRIMLDQIKAFLEKNAPPFAKIKVVNPGYEEIQVRCTVKFKNSLRTGHDIKKLDRDISDYISPWKNVGYRVRFGWSIRSTEIQTYIQGLEYVDVVTGFSMLKITDKGRDYYALQDTEESGQAKEKTIEPFYPWSLAVPAPFHHIEVTERKEPVRARETGINDLGIGNTFIISR